MLDQDIFFNDKFTKKVFSLIRQTCAPIFQLRRILNHQYIIIVNFNLNTCVD